MSKIKIEDIKAEIAVDGWKLLSDTYENLDSELVFECSEGHKVYAPWKKIRLKRECPICKANIYKDQNNKIIPKKKNTKRFLGIDQATYISGWSIYEDNKLIKYGIFEIPRDIRDDIERDHEFKVWLINMIETWEPDYVGLEGIQYQPNFGVTTFETLARLQGIAMETLFEAKIPYMICPTNTWRHHCGVTGKSRVDKKRSMQLLAKKWFDVTISEDEADAIGIGKYVSETAHVSKMIEWE